MTDSRGGCGEVRELTFEEKEYAAAYLNETDQDKESAIAEIRRWILESDDLRACTDDFFILRFLRACKFNIEKTKFKMRNYHRQRSDLPDWFANRDPFLAEMQELFDLGVFLPLQKLDKHERLVVLVRPTLHDPRKIKISNVLKASLMILDLILRDHVPASLRGVVTFIDLQGVTLGHALQMRPNVISNIVHAWQDCYPLRIKALNFINTPTYVNVILSIFKRFMNAKLKQRLHIYKSVDSCKELPTDILPVEYGGANYTTQELKEYWKEMIEKNRSWFTDNEKYKVIANAR